jgi:hypothetical protein
MQSIESEPTSNDISLSAIVWYIKEELTQINHMVIYIHINYKL